MIRLILDADFESCFASISNHDFCISGWIRLYEDDGKNSPICLERKWLEVEMHGVATPEDFDLLMSDLSQAHNVKLVIGKNKIEFDGFFRLVNQTSEFTFYAELSSSGQITFTDIGNQE